MNAKRITATVCALSCALLLSACGPDISPASYERLQTGMTLAEVESVLGGEGERQEVQGTSIGSTGLESAGNAGDSMQTYIFGAGAKQIIVVLKDGKVISKRKTGF